MGRCQDSPIRQDPKLGYPLSPTAIIHSPSVAVLRAGADDNYRLLPSDERFFAAFVSVAAIRNPRTTNNDASYGRPGDQAAMRSKIHAIFRLAVMQGYKTLVLSAIGMRGIQKSGTCRRQIVRGSDSRIRPILSSHLFRRTRQ